ALMTSRSGTSFRTSDGYSVGVVLTVPPFPYSHGYDELGKGAPVSLRQGMSDQDRDSIHYGEVAMRNGQLVTAGMVGYVAVVTGLGATVQEARDNAYRVMNGVVVPNGRYRNDIGEKLIGDDLATLTRLGWLTQ